jgi:hypothetical protein
MRLVRQPTRFLLLWTAICAVPAYFLIDLRFRPIPDGCWDMCGYGAYVATWGLFVLVMIWIVVVVLVVWLWNRR